VNNKSLTVLIPLYNKENLIQVAIEETLKLVNNIDYEIIVIENESTDNSKYIVEKIIQNSEKNIRLITSKKGLGNATKAGIEKATKDFLTVIPADFSSGTSEVEFFKHNTQHDYVITSRLHSESKAPVDINRKIISRVYNIFKKIILNLNYSDTQFSYIIKSDIAKSISTKCTSSGFFITTELAYFALKEGVLIKEIPVTIHEQENNKSTVKIFRDSFDMLIAMLKLYIREGRLA
jgi:glycosyltransferase involved in cell wall biosynthesis